MSMSLSRIYNRFLGSVVAKNFLYMLILQGLNNVLPIVTLPYLMRVLAPDNFGLVMYTQAIILYFIVVLDFGFNTTAVREIATSMGDRARLNEVFIRVMNARLLLLGLLILVTLFMVFYIDFFNVHKELYFYTSLLLVGQALFPAFVFLGLQEMKFLLVINVLIRLSYTLTVILLIRTNDDYLWVNFYNSLANVFFGSIAFFLAVNRYKLKFHWLKLKTILGELKNGLTIFISNITLYTSSSVVFIIMGMNLPDVAIGFFSVADKIVLVMRQILGVYSQVTYPRVCLIHENGLLFRKHLRTYYFPLMIAIVFVSMLIFLFSDQMVLLLMGYESDEISTLLRILIFVPVIVGLNVPFYQMLLARERRKEFTSVFIVAAFMAIVLAYWMSKCYGVGGSAIAVLITEMFVTVGLFFMYYRLKLR